MHGDSLVQILILLGAMVVVVPLFQRLGIGSVPGYLIAGMAVGPHGMGWIGDVEDVRTIAELGVVFLLFVIGIELKPARLWLMRRQVFGLGSAQIAITGFAICAVALGFGVDRKAAILAGFGLALSSTAFVLQLLGEKRELSSSHGRSAFSILLMQDMAVVPLITLVYVFSSESALNAGQVVMVVLEALAIIVGLIVLGRYALGHVLAWIAGVNNREVFAATAVLLVLGAGWLMEHAGMSMAMGAFLAGLLMAESAFRHQVVADIQPFRGFLLGLFFISVGMSLELLVVLQNWQNVLFALFGLFALKAVVIIVCMLTIDHPLIDSVRVAGLLAQGGEFAFVLFGLALSAGVMSSDLVQFLLVIVVLSMLLTPAVAALGERIAARLPASGKRLPSNELSDQSDVIVAGFGRVGRQVCNVLEAAGYSTVAVDRSHSLVNGGLKDGYNVYYGDASRPEILRALGVTNAPLLVLTMDDAEAAAETAGIVREVSPRTKVIARARDEVIAQTLAHHGVQRSIPETTEYSLQVGIAALETLGVEDTMLVEIENVMRSEEYRALKTREVTVAEPAAAGN